VRVFWSAVSVCLLLALPGCSAGDDAAGERSAASPPATAGSSPPATAGSSPSAGGSGTPSAAAGGGSSPEAGGDLGQPVASRTANSGRWSIRLDVYPIRRGDRTVTANYRVTALSTTETSSPSDRPRMQVAGLLSDGNYRSVDFDGHAADGVQLVDTKNAKAHLPASDGKGVCLCPRGLASSFIPEGGSMVFSAVYAAPPADVTTMDMTVPKFGTISRVPVQ
jgi:hypothetical protein